MYVIENGNTKPQHNLALEEILCRKAAREGTKFFMLWQNEPSIIVGRFQNTLEEINTAFVEENKIHVVRRNSGGGAVYHDLGNINYSFVMPDETGDFDFAFFTQPILKALDALGVKAELSGRNDIAIDGKKVSGGAQYRRGGIIMHHGTLLYSSDLDVLTQALKVSAEKIQSKGVKSVRSRVDNIMPYLRKPLPLDVFRQDLQNLIKDLVPMELTPAELSEVERLAREKYAAWDWNYGSSPTFTERRKARFPWGGVEVFLNVEAGRVAGCSFRGDYFGSGDYAEIEKRLIGTPYTREEVRKCLEGISPHAMFAGSQSEELIGLLAPDI